MVDETSSSAFLVQGKQIVITSCVSKGSNSYSLIIPVFSRASETEGLEGRQFAMMAAQGSDVLWIRSSVSLIFFVVASSGAKNGTSVVQIVFADVLYGWFTVFDSCFEEIMGRRLGDSLHS